MNILNLKNSDERVAIKCDTCEEMQELCLLLDKNNFKPRHGDKWAGAFDKRLFVAGVNYINLTLRAFDIEDFLKIQNYIIINFRDIAPKYYYKVKGFGTYLIYNEASEIVKLGSNKSNSFKTKFTCQEFKELCERFGLYENGFDKILVKKTCHYYKIKGSFEDDNVYLNYYTKLDEIQILDKGGDKTKTTFTQEEFESLCKRFNLDKDMFEKE